MARFDDDPFDQQAAGREWATQQRREDTRAGAVERGEITDPPPAPAGGAPRRSSAPGPVSKLTTSATRSTTKAGGSVAGVLIGFVTYALFLSYLRQGRAGPAMWFRAKFFNETGTPQPAAATAPTPTTATTKPTPTYPSPATPAAPTPNLPRRP